MKTEIYCFFVLLISACANLKERKILNEFPDYHKQLVIKGKFDADTLTDYFYILTPKKELERETSRCVLVYGSEKKQGQTKLVFDDLLPIVTMSGKIDYPFETVVLRNDTLFVCFLNSPYGHNEFEKESYTFRFNTEKQFFSLVEYKIEICMLPECEFKASLAIDSTGLVKHELPFSFSDWLVSGGYLSSANYFAMKKDSSKWQQFSIELKQIGLDSEAEMIEQFISESQ